MPSGSTIPWIEKYRPRTIDDIILDPHTKKTIQQIIDNKYLKNNIIITGSPGIGKTTTLQCIAKNLLGRHYQSGTIELNASDDRGMKAIQDTLIYFCKKSIDLRADDEQNYSPHKIIILDEADNMTSKAQHLINSLMEDYKSTTRFAFTCNNSSDIIEAIQSKCIILRYARLSIGNVIERLKYICQKEHLTYEDKALNEIALISGGDMRNAVNTLQLINTASNSAIINLATVYSVCDRPRFDIIRELFLECQKKNVVAAIKILQNLKHDGYSGSDLVMYMANVLKIYELKELSEETKIWFLEKIARSSYIISKGLDSELQLSNLAIAMCSCH